RLSGFRRPRRPQRTPSPRARRSTPRRASGRAGRQSPERRCERRSGTRSAGGARPYPRSASAAGAGCGGDDRVSFVSSSLLPPVLVRTPNAWTWTLLGACLSGLLFQDLAGIAHALLLVGIWLPQAPDVGGDLTDELPIDAGHRDVRLLLDGDVDPLGNVEHHRMRVTQRKDDLLALHLGTVPDADDVELALEPFCNAQHGVGHQAARQPVKLAELGILGRALGDKVPVRELEVDAARKRLLQLALGSLHFDGAGE